MINIMGCHLSFSLQNRYIAQFSYNHLQALYHALPMDYITVSKLHNKLEGEVNQTTVRKLIDKMTKEGFVEAQSNRRLSVQASV